MSWVNNDAPDECDDCGWEVDEITWSPFFSEWLCKICLAQKTKKYLDGK
jgi:hypothetical protein